MPDRGRCVARGRSTHALGRHARERHRQTGAAAREGVLLVCFRGGTRFVTPSAPGTMLSTPQGSARRPNPTKYPRARASSTGAGRCWLDTTTPEGHFERYTTAPRPIQSLPGLAQNRFISGSRDARRGAQGGMGPPATEYCGTRFDAGLQNAEIAFLGGWYKFETP